MRSRSNITVRYAETDQMGIVYHANYAVWYEVARTELIRKAGLPYTRMEEMGLLLPVIELNCRYISSAHYDEELVVEAWISSMSYVKMQIEYAVYRKGEDKPINRGRTIHAVVGKDMYPINFKKHAPELYEKMLAMVEAGDGRE